MGDQLIDRYSLLHFAVGIVMYYLGFSLKYTVLLNVVFELVENTRCAMKITNTTGWWPGGKPKADSVTNMIGDVVFASLGWMVANAVNTR